MIQGKKILIGISGSIAAYKTILLIRLLTKAGAQVKVVMTPAARDFVPPITLSTLIGEPVLSGLSSGDEWANHVMLGRWADVMLIAPLSCNTLSKMATGACDNLLLAVWLSATCPVLVAPAMDEDMWKHPATQRNVNQLRKDGVELLPVVYGPLASGLVGEGRMAEPESIFEFLQDFFNRNGVSAAPFPADDHSVPLQTASSITDQLVEAIPGSVPLFTSPIKVLITAGPTVEPIDPVRYISNHSTGKMGHELAMAAAKMGAQVVLVEGPVAVSLTEKLSKIVLKHNGESLTMNRQTSISPQESEEEWTKRIQVKPVVTAAEMFSVVEKEWKDASILIMAAAVADFTPVTVANTKIKKQPTQNDLVLTLKKTNDILAFLGKQKREDQILVGFALETQQEEKNALDKLQKKNADYIVLNSLNDEGAGFGYDTNKITLFSKDGQQESWPLSTKSALAKTLMDRFYSVLHQENFKR